MKGKILQDPLAFGFNNRALVVHKIIDREILFQRIVDAIETALLKTGKVERGLAKGFAGDSASIDGASAHISALDDGDVLAKIGSLRACLFPRRTAADDDEIEIFAGRQRFLPSRTKATLTAIYPCASAPLGLALMNRDVAVDGEVGEALFKPAGLRPDDLDPIEFGPLSDSKHEPGIMRGEIAAAAHLHAGPLQIASLVVDAGADSIDICRLANQL